MYSLCNSLVEHKDNSKNDIPVVICASENRMGAAMATINSVHSNTDASLIFFIVTLEGAIQLTRFVLLFNIYVAFLLSNSGV
jgi:hypothetical protein